MATQLAVPSPTLNLGLSQSAPDPLGPLGELTDSTIICTKDQTGKLQYYQLKISRNEKVCGFAQNQWAEIGRQMQTTLETALETALTTSTLDQQVTQILTGGKAFNIDTDETGVLSISVPVDDSPRGSTAQPSPPPKRHLITGTQELATRFFNQIAGYGFQDYQEHVAEKKALAETARRSSIPPDYWDTEMAKDFTQDQIETVRSLPPIKFPNPTGSTCFLNTMWGFLLADSELGLALLTNRNKQPKDHPTSVIEKYYYNYIQYRWNHKDDPNQLSLQFRDLSELRPAFNLMQPRMSRDEAQAFAAGKGDAYSAYRILRTYCIDNDIITASQPEQRTRIFVAPPDESDYIFSMGPTQFTRQITEQGKSPHTETTVEDLKEETEGNRRVYSDITAGITINHIAITPPERTSRSTSPLPTLSQLLPGAVPGREQHPSGKQVDRPVHRQDTATVHVSKAVDVTGEITTLSTPSPMLIVETGRQLTSGTNIVTNPVEIDFNDLALPAVTFYAQPTPDPVTYKLTSIVVNPPGAHFYSYVLRDNRWYRANDNVSTQVTKQEILADSQIRDHHFVTQLIYTKTDCIPHPKPSSTPSTASPPPRYRVVDPWGTF